MEKKNVASNLCPWVRGNCIGKGSFGTVSLAVNKANGRIFAVKSVNSTLGLSSHVESLENEIEILQSLSSPYVVEYLGDDLTRESPATSYRNLYMEYMPGGTVADLATQLGGKGAAVEEEIVRSYTWCILSALRYIHSKGVVHCDVKGRNILVGSTPGIAKLADFGSAKKVSGDGERMIMPRGTPLWMAPEVVRQERQGPESDVWSLGCTIIEMVTGKPGWQNCGAMTMSRIGFSNELPEFPAQLSEMGRDFLDKCLRRAPSERWTCDQLLQHPFVSANLVAESSPRCVLDWTSSEFCEDEEIQLSFYCNSNNLNSDSLISGKEKIRRLASHREGVLWESDGWEMVREVSICDRGETEEGEGTSWENSNLICSGEESEGTSWGYSNSVSSNGGEWLDYVRTCTRRWCGSKAGLGCQYGLQKGELVGAGKRREKGFYFCRCCNLLFLIFHLMIWRSNLLFLFVGIISACEHRLPNLSFSATHVCFTDRNLRFLSVSSNSWKALECDIIAL
ncbi:hypothetical protein HHK36_018835 [Tetracentron sinense]|uniref:Protein kinase domain-containing protein n=1 Tax=Tetracentron sinense TaxID=13715 RepID=A0A834Z136_TETSI|nr:hypothetical protein HHK36_018835 [Tetracentron sinense]